MRALGHGHAEQISNLSDIDTTPVLVRVLPLLHAQSLRPGCHARFSSVTALHLLAKKGRQVNRYWEVRRRRTRDFSNLRTTWSYDSANSDSMDPNVSSDGFKTCIQPIQA